MNLLTWVLVGVAAYWLLLAALQARGVLPSSVGVSGPVLTVHTKRGLKLLDWLSRPRRFWRAWTNFGLGIALVVALGTFLLLVQTAISVLQDPPAPSAVNQPRNFLVIPGLNDFLPPSVAPEIVFGLLLALVVHELGHGVLCRVGDIDVESMGVLLFTVVPIGAFVLPDEESQRAADRGSTSRMFAAGVTNNFALMVLTFLLLFGPVAGSISVASGAAVGGVYPNSAAADGGVQDGDRIVAVAGNAVESNADLDATLSDIAAEEVDVELVRDGERRTETVTRSLLVTGVTTTSPFASALTLNSTVTTVNDTEVRTEQALRASLENRTRATLHTADGNATTGPVGALVVARPDSPAVTGDVPAETPVVVTAVDGERVVTGSDLTDAVTAYSPNDTITLDAYVPDNEAHEHRTYNVTLGADGSGAAMLGVDVAPGISGITFNDLGVDLYPASAFLGILGGEFDALISPGDGGNPVRSFVLGMVGALVLPLASAVLGIDYKFAGFVGSNAEFYTVDGPLAVLGGGTFLLANVLFWTGWINLNLGFFNCIPAFPLDGGHILRTSAEAVISRLPIDDRRRATRIVTTSIGLLMLVSLVLMVFGPDLLGGA